MIIQLLMVITMLSSLPVSLFLVFYLSVMRMMNWLPSLALGSGPKLSIATNLKVLVGGNNSSSFHDNIWYRCEDVLYRYLLPYRRHLPCGANRILFSESQISGVRPDNRQVYLSVHGLIFLSVMTCELLPRL